MQAAERSGLARLRHLTADSKNLGSEKSAKNLPSGWYFNESKEEDIWDDLEKHEKTEKHIILEGENKRTENTTKMSESSNKLRYLVQRFDELDQETLYELQKLCDEDGEELETDVSGYFATSKTSVVGFIDELTQYAENQTQLLESLKSSFHLIQGTSAFLREEAKDQENDKDSKTKVLEEVAAVVSENIDRAEKAAELHSGVSRYWVKQLANFKRVVTEKDEKIANLDKKNYELKEQISKVKMKKELQKEQQSKAEETKKQMETYIRTIETQKAQLTQLRKELQNSEAGRAAIGIVNDNTTSSSNLSRFQLERQAETNSQLLDNEVKINQLTAKTEELYNELQKAKNATAKEMNTSQELKAQITLMNQQNNEKDQQIQKYIKLLQIEQNRAKELESKEPKTVMIESKENAEEEKMLLIMKHQAEIKELNQQNASKMAEQAEMLREKFAKEKKELIEYISKGDEGAAIQRIVNQYEEKMSLSKREYDASISELIRSWGGKLALLTRQYESRYRSLIESHEIELQKVKDTGIYELQRSKIELEDELEKKLLEAAKKYMEAESSTEAEIQKLKHIIDTQKTDIDILKSKIGEDINLEDEKHSFANTGRMSPAIAASMEARMTTAYATKLKTMKEEILAQNEWELARQKEFYEKRIETLITENQKNIRSLVTKTTETLSRIVIEGEDSISLSDALASFADILTSMNDVVEEADRKPKETVALDEVTGRMNALTEKIAKLRNELEESHDKDTPAPPTEDTDALLEKIRFLESLQNGKNDDAMAAMKALEENLKAELEIKDQLIEHYKAEKELRESFFGDFNHSVIFEYYAEEILESDESDEEKIQLQIADQLKRSQPNFLISEDIDIGKNKLRSTNSMAEVPPIFDEVPNLENLVPVVIKLDSPKRTPIGSPIASQKSEKTATLSPKSGKTAVHSPKSEEVPVISPKREKLSEKSAQTSPKRSIALVEPPTNESQGITEAETDTSEVQNSMLSQPTQLEKAEEEVPPSKIQIHTVMRSSKLPPKQGAKRTIELSRPLSLDGASIFQAIDLGLPGLELSTPDPVAISPKQPKKRLIVHRQMRLESQEVYSHQSEAKKPKQITEAPRILSIYCSGEFQLPQRIVTMQAQPAPRVVKYSGDRDIAHFAPIELSGEDSRAHLIPGYFSELSDLIDGLIAENIAEALSDPGVLEANMKQLREHASKDDMIDYQERTIKELTSQLRKLQEAYRLSQQSQATLNALRRQNQIQFDFNEPEEDEAENKSVRSERKKSARSSGRTPAIAEKDSIPKLQLRENVVIRNIKVEEEGEIADVSDPFTAAIQQLATNMRFMTEYRSNESSLAEAMRADALAYESFMTATGTVEPNAESFIKQIKQSTSSAMDNVEQLNSFELMQHKLLSILRASKKKSVEMKQLGAEIAKKQMSEEITKAQNDLRSMMTAAANEKDGQRAAIQKIRTALEVIDTLDIELSEEDTRQVESLRRRVNDSEQKISKGEQADGLDHLGIAVQSLLAGLKPSLRNDELKQQIKESAGSLKEAQKKLKYLQKENDQLSIELSHTSTRLENALQHISSLKSRIAEETGTNQNTVSLYSAQIAMLRDLLGQLGTNESAQGNGDLVGAIRNQVLCLQGIAETSRAERDSFKSKLDLTEEQLHEKENQMVEMQKQIDQLADMNADLEKKMRRVSEEALFHETDIERIRMERALEEANGQSNRMQLEEALGQNAELHETIKRIEDEKAKIKNKLRITQTELEDLQIKYSFGHYQRAIIPHTAVATQTTFKLVIQHRRPKPKKPNPASEETQEDVPSNNNNESREITDETENIVDKKEEEEKHEGEEEEDNPLPIVRVESVEQIAQSQSGEAAEERLGLADTSTSSFYASQELWIDVHSDEDPDQFPTDLTKVSAEKSGIDVRNFGNDYVGYVHDPFKIKKDDNQILKKTLLDTKRSGVKKPRPTTAITRTFGKGDANTPLAIGDVIQGKRPLGGADGRVKVRLVNRKMHSPLARKNAPHLDPVSSTVHWDYPIPMSPSPKLKTPKPARTPDISPLEDADSLRITSVQYEISKTSNNSPRQPIVIPFSRTPPSTMKTSPEGSPQKEDPDMTGVQKIVQSLREKNNELMDELEKRDQQIAELKKWLSDLTRETQHQRMDIVRAEDSSRKATIRYDHVKARLEIVTSELEQRSGEVASLRKEVLQLRKAAAPANATLNRVKNAQFEQRRIEEEKIHQGKMLSAAKKAMEKAKDENVQKHLKTLLENTNKSLRRLEASRRQWQNIEKCQMISALAAMSLIDAPANDVLSSLQLPPAVYRRRVRPTPTRRQHTPIPSQPPTPARTPMPSYKRTMEIAGEMDPPLSPAELRSVLHGSPSPEVSKRLREVEEKEQNDTKPLSDTIVSGHITVN